MQNAVAAPNDFQISLTLADNAQAVAGKLYMMGGGWNIKGPQAAPTAIAGILSVPWGETNRPHNVEFSLVDANGQPFMVTTAEGQQQPLTISAQISVGRPVGIPAGMALNVPLAFNIGPLLLQPGMYEWRVRIDGAGRDHWRLPFAVLAQWPPPGHVG